MLTADQLVALSVDKLEKEVRDVAYSVEVLGTALGLEQAGQNRKTAVEAIENAIAVQGNAVKEPEPEPEPEPDGKVRVAKGKAITSKLGILSEGSEVEPKFFANGEATIKDLLSKGYLVR